MTWFYEKMPPEKNPPGSKPNPIPMTVLGKSDIYRLAWKYWSNTDMELHDAEEPIGMRKILAHNMGMKKNPQT